MLSLYIHIPFCVRKCPYCGFFSTRYDAALADRYLEAVQQELELHSQSLGQRTISTVYVGGGTPTVLNSGQLSRLFQITRKAICLSSDAEITVEVNPVTASRELCEVLKALCVTRLSIGVQSFSDEILSTLGRSHRSQDARNTVSIARAAGFRNIGIDLMYAIPGQTTEHWTATLEESLALSPEHLSLYCLSLDEGSQFWAAARRGELILPSDDTAADQYSTACDQLERHGFLRYELSNLARPGFLCKHNLNYWTRGEYLGIGAAAWSFMGGVRSANITDIEAYIKRIASRVSVKTFEERPGQLQAASETLFLGLRTATGVDLDRFALTYGNAAHMSLLRAIEQHRSTGLYEVTDRAVRLTRRGMLLANDAIEALLP